MNPPHRPLSNTGETWRRHGRNYSQSERATAADLLAAPRALLPSPPSLQSFKLRPKAAGRSSSLLTPSSLLSPPSSSSSDSIQAAGKGRSSVHGHNAAGGSSTQTPSSSLQSFKLRPKAAVGSSSFLPPSSFLVPPSSFLSSPLPLELELHQGRRQRPSVDSLPSLITPSFISHSFLHPLCPISIEPVPLR